MSSRNVGFEDDSKQTLRGVKLALFCCIVLSILLPLTSGCKKTVTPPPVQPDSTDTLFVFPITTNTTLHLNAVRVFLNTIWLCGENGLLRYGTEQTGFTQANLPTSASLWDLIGTNSSMLVCGSDGNVLRSYNGDNWYLVLHVPNVRFSRFAMDAIGRVWVVADNNYPFVSVTPFDTWVRYTNVAGTSISSFTTIGFHPTNGRGFLGATGVGFRTTNNGVDWAGPTGLSMTPSCVLYVGETELLMGSMGGHIFRSYDSGQIWEETNINSLSVEVINKICKVNNTLYIAVSSYYVGMSRFGRIWYSNNRQDWRLAGDFPHEIRDVDYNNIAGIHVSGTEGFLAHVNPK